MDVQPDKRLQHEFRCISLTYLNTSPNLKHILFHDVPIILPAQINSILIKYNNKLRGKRIKDAMDTCSNTNHTALIIPTTPSIAKKRSKLNYSMKYKKRLLKSIEESSSGLHPHATRSTNMKQDKKPLIGCGW